MIPQNQKLNKELFAKDVEKNSMRVGFGKGLLEAGENNLEIVALCADLTESTQMIHFKDRFPDRFVEIGVAEQNLVTVASGMASMGKIPFCASYAVFSPGRNWEQIRTTIAYNDMPVKIIGSHAGITVGPDGGSHQALEDIAMMRAMPNMIVISPCDLNEAKKATLEMVKINKPFYMRLIREKTPIITTGETPFEIGKGQILFDTIVGNPDVTIIATGALVYNALLCAKELEKNKIGVRVINISTIKPLDKNLIIRSAKDSGAIITVEDHQIIGGLGGAVAELLAQEYPVPMEFIGVKDKFGQSGNSDELIEYYELGTSHIKKAVNKVLKRKIVK